MYSGTVYLYMNILYKVYVFAYWSQKIVGGKKRGVGLSGVWKGDLEFLTLYFVFLLARFVTASYVR